MIVVYVKSVGVVITRSEKGDSDRGWYFQVLGWWQSRQRDFGRKVLTQQPLTTPQEALRDRSAAHFEVTLALAVRVLVRAIQPCSLSHM
jgi:hypothetical protein